MYNLVAEARGHHFLARNLSEQAVVLDVGGNLGEFAQEVVQRWGVRCISVEANPELCRNWTAPSKVIHAAISSTTGECDFYLSDNSEGSSIFSGEGPNSGQVTMVPSMTLEHIIQDIGSPDLDLLKLDVEGAEIEVLLNAEPETLERIKQVTVEFHDFILPQVTIEDVEKVKRRLHNLGFWSISFSRRDTDVLFINSRTAGVSRLEYLYARYFLKNILGFGRVFKRQFESGES